jgi:hypothetical protein
MIAFWPTSDAKLKSLLTTYWAFSFLFPASDRVGLLVFVLGILEF